MEYNFVLKVFELYYKQKNKTTRTFLKVNLPMMETLFWIWPGSAFNYTGGPTEKTYLIIRIKGKKKAK